MRPLLYIWWRAFSIVTLTALNVLEVSHGRTHAAFFTGGALSFVWWVNARTAAHSDVVGAKWAYSFGAACGTVVGMVIGRLLG